MLSIDNQQLSVSFSLHGTLDTSTSYELREKAFALLTSGTRHFTFDFTNVEKMDSVFLGVIVSLYNKVKDKDGEVAVRGLNGESKVLFLKTRLDRVFKTVQ